MMGLSDDIKQRIADDCIASSKARMDYEAAKVLKIAGYFGMVEVPIVESGNVLDATGYYGGWLPSGLGASGASSSEMFPDISDPLISPLPPTVTGWDAKERRVEWVRHNFSKGELAMLYKLSYDVDGLKRAACDVVIAKEKKA